MADVLIVCVREDEPQAKALADMFERAGFSVGGAPSNEGALRSSGAGVIVWSHASIRSRPFLDAAQRVVNAKKAVVACLIEAPPPASINDSPAFELIGWNGDPDDPMLDPLFFAVDRMVNSARAAVGAPTAQPQTEAFDPPPSLRPPPNAPPYARAARTAPPAARQPPPQPQLPPGFQMRTPPAPAPAPAQNDPLSSEAELWRSIRHSNDPTVFLDYLARYGQDGAFSEIAEQKLKQLEGAQQQQRPAARAPEPPPRAYEPTPQRRPEPAPAPRRREREIDRNGYERDRDRPSERRERERPFESRVTHVDDPPKRSSGLGLRLLILFVLLGGGALAAGMYFGGPDRFNIAAPIQQSDSNGAVAGDEPASAASETVTENGTGGPALDVVTPEPVDFAVRESTPARAPVRTAANTTEPEPPTPAPTYSWDSRTLPANASPGANNSGGPVSLIPAAPEPTTQPASVQTTTSAPPAVTARGTVSWAQRPTNARIGAVYPRRALRDNVGGRAVLDCTIRADLGVACTLVSETPAGAGFGRAALDASAYYRASSMLSDGSPAPGARTRLSLVFQPPSD